MISHQTRLTNTCRTAVRGLELLSLSTPPFICHLTLSCDGMNTPLLNPCVCDSMFEHPPVEVSF